MVRGDGLNDKQRRFVAEYLIDLNATQAAVRAGYSQRTAESQASRLLRNAKVQAAVSDAQREREKRTEITADSVLRRLNEVAERCMQAAPVMVRRGNGVVQKTDEEGNPVWEFDSAGANRALELLGKHLKLFTDKQEHSGPNGAPLGPVEVVFVKAADAR